MTDPAVPLKRRRFVDVTPLRVSPAFARLWFGGAISGIGAMLTVVAVGLQVYDITESTFAVSLVGGIGLVPLIVAGLWGGMIADAFDRKKVLIASALVGWSSTIGLALIAWFDTTLSHPPVWPLYVLATLGSVAATVQMTTRAAVTPRLLPGELIPAASALNGISFGVQLTLGPALAGVLVASVGAGEVLAGAVEVFGQLSELVPGLLEPARLRRDPQHVGTYRPREGDLAHCCLSHSDSPCTPGDLRPGRGRTEPAGPVLPEFAGTETWGFVPRLDREWQSQRL